MTTELTPNPRVLRVVCLHLVLLDWVLATSCTLCEANCRGIFLLLAAAGARLCVHDFATPELTRAFAHQIVMQLRYFFILCVGARMTHVFSSSSSHCGVHSARLPFH